MFNSILIVEDDITFSKLLQAWFTKKKWNVTLSNKVTDAKKKIRLSQPDVIICDLRLPKYDGTVLLNWVKVNYPKIVVIMMTGYADVQTAVSSIKLGAYDYIPKPFNPTELFDKINEAFEVTQRKEKKEDDEKDDIVSTEFVKGTSLKYNRLYRYVDLVAPTDMSVLIVGESGVGKEHIAREIHQKSDRKDAPFVAVDCGVLSKELAGSDLFGHIKGAFTGALMDKAGAFITANKGTIFLDEIGNLEPDVQIRLLRVLQERKIKPIGSDKEIEIDFRIITATNEDLNFAVKNGSFRIDLYHRISEFILEVPALKEVKSDIPLFLNFFLEKANKKLNKNIKSFSDEAVKILTDYDWSGNIRELKNIVNRLTLLTTGDIIEKDFIPNHLLEDQKKEYHLHIVDKKEKIGDTLSMT